MARLRERRESRRTENSNNLADSRRSETSRDRIHTAQNRLAAVDALANQLRSVEEFQAELAHLRVIMHDAQVSARRLTAYATALASSHSTELGAGLGTSSSAPSGSADLRPFDAQSFLERMMEVHQDTTFDPQLPNARARAAPSDAMRPIGSAFRPTALHTLTQEDIQRERDRQTARRATRESASERASHMDGLDTIIGSWGGKVKRR